MALYHYQALTAPVGINPETPQQPVFWYVQGTRASTPPHPTHRENLVFVTLIPEVIATVDQWLPQDPHQFRYRAPQRNYTAHVIISGFEATNVDQWGWQEPQKYRPRPIQRSDFANPIFLLEAALITLEWLPYDTQKVYTRPPHRDYTAAPVAPPTGTSVREWHHQETQKVYIRRLGRDYTAASIASRPGTTPDQWAPFVPVRGRPGFIAHRVDPVFVTLIDTAAGTEIPWHPLDRTRFLSRQTYTRDALTFTTPFTEPPVPSQGPYIPTWRPRRR